MIRILSLVSLVFLAAACDKGPAPQEPVAPASGQSRMGAVKDAVRKNWEALKAKIPNADAREEQILDTIKSAGEYHKKMKDALANGEDYKPYMEKAKTLFEEASNKFDELQEEVMNIDKDLWAAKFKSFQSQWERYSTKELRRIGFQR